MTIMTALRGVRDSRVTLVVVASTALFLDEFLLAVVVPILPVVFLDMCLGLDSSTFAGLGNVTGYSPTSLGPITATDVNESPYKECERAVNTQMGLFFGCQFAIRVVMGFFGNYICERFGFHLPMFVGCTLLLVSSLVYAIAESHAVYFTARMIHGLAAIPNDVAALGLLAYRFRDNDETRGFVLGIAISGFAVGTMISPPFGGVVFFYLGKAAPFIIIAGFLGLLALAEIVIYDHSTTQEKVGVMATVRLLLDPLILVQAGVLTIASMGFGLLEPSLPIWMLGIVFLPLSIASIIGSLVLGYFSYKIGRWLCAAVSMVVLGIALSAIPFGGNIAGLIAPMTMFGLSFGSLDATTCALFNLLVEQRHRGAYGGAATLTIITFSIGFVVGPALSAALVNVIGFPWMLRGTGILTVLCSPLCLFMRNVDRAPSSGTNEEERMLILGTHKPETVVCQGQS
ncbi:synaptic vesicular amine transporter-like isoform X2 [Acanthaster planci]|uniref:Synaptic vesicular amine transporter-like isoform X2 n=1 Tax=Acanthaster planci TaxID=133434 RepID=A0A8B7YR40_ACAPL|nr:synaptic vesicular amine transporter-like isoform X2 [Acanthaster planci]